jgi:hypothetical protein
MTEQTFGFVTLSKTGDTPKLRFTNHALTRTKRLKAGGVTFVKLPKEMTKLEAANWMLKHPGDADVETLKAAVERVVARFTPKQPREKKEKVAKPKASTKKAPKKAAKKATKKSAPKGAKKATGGVTESAKKAAAPHKRSQETVEVEVQA